MKKIKNINPPSIQKQTSAKRRKFKTLCVCNIEYIHANPVKRGYVNEAQHWRYSSARDYEGISGLIDVERFW